jgi:Lysozyme like domain
VADRVLSDAAIVKLLRAQGFRGVDLAIGLAVALAESGGRVGIVSPPNRGGTVDRDLLQINSSHTQFDAKRLVTDPAYNAAAARAVWNAQGWSGWSTYKNGRFIKFWDRGVAAAGLAPSTAAPTFGAGTSATSSGTVTAVPADLHIGPLHTGIPTPAEFANETSRLVVVGLFTLAGLALVVAGVYSGVTGTQTFQKAKATTEKVASTAVGAAL